MLRSVVFRLLCPLLVVDHKSHLGHVDTVHDRLEHAQLCPELVAQILLPAFDLVLRELLPSLEGLLQHARTVTQRRPRARVQSVRA